GIRRRSSLATSAEGNPRGRRLDRPPALLAGLDRKGSAAHPRRARRCRRGTRRCRDAQPLGGAESFDLALNGEPLERVGLDLAHALARDAQATADLLERGGLDVSVQAVAELDHVALALRQLGDGAPEDLHVEADRDLLVRPGLI